MTKAKKLKCPKCGTMNDMDAEFCKKCGNPRPKVAVKANKKADKQQKPTQSQKQSPAILLVKFVFFLVIFLFIYSWLSGSNPIGDVGHSLSGVKTCEWTDSSCISKSIQNCELMKTRVETMAGYREWKIEGRQGDKCKMTNNMEEMFDGVTKSCLYGMDYLSNKTSFSDLGTTNYCDVKRI